MKSGLICFSGILLAALLQAVSARSEPSTGAASQHVTRVRVAPSGEVYLDEEPVSAGNLTNALQRLRGLTDAVAFSGDTNAASGLLNTSVFEKIVRSGLPVVMRKSDGSPRDDSAGDEPLVDVDFRNLPVGEVLNFYAGLTGAKLLKPIGISASITLSLEDATQGEALKAVELELSRYNLSLKRSEDDTISVQWKTDW